MQRAKQVTAKDIALAVGVSRQAVSAVLSGSNPNCVSVAVREKITAEAAKLGYRPNTAALRLAGHKTRQIGLLLGSYGFTIGFPTMLADEIRKRNYRPVLMIANNTAEADDAAAELHSGAYDGIFIGTHTSWQHSDFRVPVVMQEFGQCDINIDLQAAGRMAAKHMLQQGYGKLVFFSMISYWTADKKFAGAAEVSGGGIKHIIAEHESDPAQTLLNELDLQKRTGIICSDDILAARLVNLLRMHSIDVPRQVGIIGYGGYHYGTLVDPVLTTLAYPAQEMAVKVADMLINKVKNNIFSAPSEPLSLVPQLKIGGTTSSSAAESVFNDIIKELCNQAKK
jgi:DNA-binding LacI/PurR family transcriptional regulator